MPAFVLLLFAFFVSCAFAADQEQPTPYDLIRPVWPMKWDTASGDDGGTVQSFSHFVPNPSKHNTVPKVGSVPQDFKPNAFIPDTLNQAFIDAMNMRIGRIRVNQAGYLPDDPEMQFYYVSSGNCTENFSIVDLDGNEVATGGTFTPSGLSTSSSWEIIASTDAATNDQVRYNTETEGPSGKVCIGNLSQLAENLAHNTRYRIKVLNHYSSTFIISERVYSMIRDALLKFFGINRSGNSESWFHKPSHTKDGGGTLVNSGSGGSTAGITVKEGDLQGGWYDCGDHLKESYTQGLSFMVLTTTAAGNADRDDNNYAYNHGETVNIEDIPDILREAKHGADFFLRAYRVANGVIDNMPVSIGNFGADHGWWARPEIQDAIPATRKGSGGPSERDVRLGELGANVSSEIAAGLAILGRDYARYDKAFADSCKMVAVAMYDFAKNLALGNPTYGGGKPFVHNTEAGTWSSAAYNGGNSYLDDISIAAVALHYGTYPDSGMKYLNDAAEDQTLRNDDNVGVAHFRGGWFAASPNGMKKSSNTSWADVETFALYSFYKLLLKDDSTAASFGISHDDRLYYAENIAYTLANNISARSSSGSNGITIPHPDNGTAIVTATDLWYQMQYQMEWIYNRYQAGNIFDLFAYVDVTKDLEGVRLPQKGVQTWNSAAMKQLGINQLNYLFGVNPWDISFLIGVGDKNDAHPHHRAANPEGKNIPGATYKYNPPVGALIGAPAPKEGNAWIPGMAYSWKDHFKEETCIDATSMFLAAATMVIKEEDRNRAPKDIGVEIRYVGYDSAIVKITQDIRGTAMILYSTNETGPFNVPVKDTVPGMSHEIHLTGLQNGTSYFFKVVAINSRSEAYTTKWLVDSTSTPYSFTTLVSPPGDADIQNIKVCNLSSDSAEIMWYTPNGQYESKMYWDTTLTSYDKMQWNTGDINADVSGIPTNFHYVKIGGLKEKTTYYYCVESNGSRSCINDKGAPLKFTTPVTRYNFDVTAYQYEFTGLDFMNLNLVNNEERAFDSLELRLYVTARPDEIEATPGENNQPGTCPLLIDEDICQAYDEAGFNKPCLTTDGSSADEMIRYNLRHSVPIRLDDTYDAATGTYGWYFPIPLGGTEIKSASRMRIDLGFSSGIYQNGGCETLRQPGKIRFSAAGGHWSWAPHKREIDGADYDGMPEWEKDQGDKEHAPVNPYIAVYRKDEFISGFSPSYSEMATKRADYKLTVSYDPPFNLSNGSYVQIDSSKSTLYATGTAVVTESGYITDIWVNGVALSKAQRETAAVYDPSTGRYLLNIPVKMTIGTNKVDITVFAGPNPECESCQEFGGCAFVNRNYYVQFSKGDRTAGKLQLLREDGNSVSSPVTEDPMKFKIFVSDKDNNKHETVSVTLHNSRTGEATSVTLKRTDEALGYFESDWFSAVNNSNAVLPNVALVGGDTINVIYIDADDDEDSTSQYFYANPTTPIPQTVMMQDENCNSKADQLTLTFSGSQFDGSLLKLDSVLVEMENPVNSDSVSFMLKPTQTVSGSEAVIAIDESLVPETTAPVGKATIYMTENNIVKTATANISDGIAPKLTSVAILENENHARVQDTLKIAFSEPVNIPSKNSWILRVVTNGAEVNQTSISVIKATTSDNGKTWQYVIEGNTDGVLVKQDYKAEIAEGISISDMSANPLSTFNGPVTIIESIRPIPVKYAYIEDKEGDGNPDTIYIEFTKTLRDKDMVDTIDVYWGSPSVYHAFAMPTNGWALDTIYGEKTAKPITQLDSANGTWSTRSSTTCATKEDTVYNTRKVYVIDSITGLETDVVDHIDTLSMTITTKEDKTNCTTTIDSTFIPEIVTIGYDTVQSTATVIRIPIPEGVYANTTYGAQGGNGTLLPRKGPLGGFFDDNTATLFDKCPPILVTAKADSSGSFTTLTVIASEPLVADSSDALEYIERKRGSTAGVYLRSSKVVRMNGSKQTYTYMTDADDAIHAGDSIRLVPLMNLSRYKDVAGNSPTDKNPWRMVTGAAGNIKFEVTLANGVTKANGNEFSYSAFPPAQDEAFRITVLKEGKEYFTNIMNNILMATTNAADNSYLHAGPVFSIEITLPSALILDTLGGEVALVNLIDVKFSIEVFDNMGQFINSETITINGETVRKVISDDGVIRMNLEWLAHNGEAPISSKGKKIGTGAYIAKFTFKAKETNIKTQQKSSSSDDTTKAFGFKRAKKK